MEGTLTKQGKGILTGTVSGTAQIAIPSFDIAVPAIRIHTPSGDITAPAMVLTVTPSAPSATVTFQGVFNGQVEIEGQDRIQGVITGTVKSTLRLDGASETNG